MNEKERQEERLPEERLAPETSGAEELPAETGEGEPDAERMERLARDVREFTRRYPQVDLERLRNDGNFMLFCGSRYGNEPLVKLFEDYAALLDSVREEERARTESKADRGTGSGGSGGGQALTADQQKALEEWNRAYPQMKMTAKEFLSR